MLVAGMTLLTVGWVEVRVKSSEIKNLTSRSKEAKRGQNPPFAQLILHQEFNSVTITKRQDPLRRRQKRRQDYGTLFQGRIGGMNSSCFKACLGKSGKTA